MCIRFEKYPIMKIKAKLFLSIFILALLFYSCGKCSYKPVGQPYCVKGYDELEDVEINRGDYHENFGKNSPYVIRNQAQYDSLMPDYQPYDVDFDNYSLLGVEIGTDWGDDINSICWVCRKEETNEFKMYVKYSLKDQCAGSGIYSMYLAYWVKVPKLSEDARVYFHVIDVNPFD